MSIATAITNAQNKVAAAYTAVSNKGGTLPATQNLSNLATAIGSISGSSDLPNFVSIGVSTFTDNSITKIRDHAFSNCNHTNVTNPITTISCSNVTEIQAYAFQYCDDLVTAYFPALQKIYTHAFDGCANLEQIDLSLITAVSSSGSSLKSTFQDCSKLTQVVFYSHAEISYSKGMQYAFSFCTHLASVSFPALTSTSFGSYTNQFNSMLDHVTGCTVHFPSNLQSVIGSWTDVTAGFGGTNTTVLFDLTATT